MEYFPQGTVSKAIIVRFDPGDLLLEGLQDIIQKEKIDTAIVISGIGSFSRTNFHIITHTGYPPVDKFFEMDGPVEVASIQGIIAGGEPHLHASLYNCETKESYAGHLEPGTRVCYLVEMSILVIDSLKMSREKNPATGTVMLTEKR